MPKITRLNRITESPRFADVPSSSMHSFRCLPARTSAALALAALFSGLAVSSGVAANQTWTGGGSGTNWNTAGNWGGTAPSGGDALIFAGSTKFSNVNNFTTGTTFAGITFASGASAFTLAGNGITLTGSIVNSSSNLQTITLPTVLSAIQTFDTGGSGLTIGATGGGATGAISGVGSVTKIGSGTLTLNATNTYTGATTISAGTLLLGNSGVGALSSSTAVTVASGAIFNMGSYSSSVGSIAGAGNINGTGNITLTSGGNNASTEVSGNISFTGGAGSGTLIKNGTGTLTLSGTNTYGATTINAGTLVFQKTSAKGTGTATAGASGTIGLGVGGTGFYNATQVASLFNTTLAGFTLASGSGVAIDTTAGNFTQGTALTAARALTKLGANTLTLTTANTYSGGTKINAGTVLANNTTGSALGTGAATVNSGATLGGTGFIGAFTTISSGGQLAPGNSPGTITFTNGLAFESGAIINFELGTLSDSIVVTGGTLSSAGSESITINLSDSGDFGIGTYTLIDGTGASFSSIDEASFELGSIINGYNYAFTRSDDLLQLTVTAVPEPATCAALTGLAALALVAGRRFRSRRAS